MPVWIPYPTFRQQQMLRPDVRQSHPLWGRQVFEQEFTQQSLKWTIARLVEGRWVPLTAEDAAAVLEGQDEDGIYTIKTRQAIEADPLLRFECACRHQDGVRYFQSFAGLRNHLSAQAHPKLEVRAARQHAAAALWAALALIAGIATCATGTASSSNIADNNTSFTSATTAETAATKTATTKKEAASIALEPTLSRWSPEAATLASLDAIGGVQARARTASTSSSSLKSSPSDSDASIEAKAKGKKKVAAYDTVENLNSTSEAARAVSAHVALITLTKRKDDCDIIHQSAPDTKREGIIPATPPSIR
ncbi:hypothetical protein V8E36_004997 [Tilletia maclaganii]